MVDDDKNVPDRLPDDVSKSTDREVRRARNVEHDGLDPTRVDIDRDELGQYRGNRVEVIDEVNGPLVSAEQRHRWNRECVLVSMFGFCLYCDRDVDSEHHTLSDGKEIERYVCEYCNEQWVMDDE